MRLICVFCGRTLTRECRLGTIGEHNPSPEIREPAVPQGIIVVLPDEATSSVFADGLIIETRLLSPAGAFALHPRDLDRNCVVSVGRDNGCCGSDGSDGPNRGCLCGATLGTEWSDCWTQAEIRLNPDAVVVA
jgi:hypothetical protein